MRKGLVFPPVSWILRETVVTISAYLAVARDVRKPDDHLLGLFVMTQVDCYLCGNPIGADEASDDHVVPQQFINRAQPKARGFDYAGYMPSHKTCNNRFGPERYCRKALILLKALHDEDCATLYQHRDDPRIRMMALNSDYFPGFTEQDLRFFKIIDVRKSDKAEWSSPAFFTKKPKGTPKYDSLHIALAVLAKSASALLISRQIKEIPPGWRIIAVPYIGARDVDFDGLFGPTKPFEDGVKAWIAPLENDDWLIVYKADETLVYFLFWFSGIPAALQQIHKTFEEASPLIFEGACLNDLIGYEWKRA